MLKPWRASLLGLALLGLGTFWLVQMKMACGILKNSDAALREGATAKYTQLDKLKAVWPVTLMSLVPGVSVSGFFPSTPHWRATA